MEEEVNTNSGNKIKIQCTYLSPRKARQILDKVYKIDELKPTSIEVTDENGNLVTKEAHSFKGNFGVFMLKDYALENVIVPCPQRDEITSEEEQRIFEKYAEKTLEAEQNAVLNSQKKTK